MATYAVRLYQNSGFNSINIPDSPTLLNTVTYVDVDSISVLQQRFLSEIIVRANWNQVENCDYCRIGDFYYMVTNVQMMSTESARLSLLPDFITSSGGVKDPSFTILDGITDRATVKKSDDTWGAYTEEDPLLTPNNALQLVTEWENVPEHDAFGERLGIKGDPVFIESTIDFADQVLNEAGKEYKDESGGTCTVPSTYTNRNRTEYSISGSEEEWSNGTSLYNRDDTTALTPDGEGTSDFKRCYSNVEVIKEGMAQVRALGIEGGIINQWTVPKSMIGAIEVSDTKRYPDGYTATSGSTSISATDTVYTKVTGATGTITPGTDLAAGYASPKNLRVLYGSNNKYGIMTTAGNSMEAKPEELMSSESTPTIDFGADPRPAGKPYYRFHSLNGDTDFWRNCIAGSQWANVPFVYQGASGTALNRLNYENQRYIENTANMYAGSKRQQQAVETNQALDFQRQMQEQSVWNMLGGAAVAGAGVATGNLSGLGSTFSGSFPGGVSQGISQAYTQQQIQNAQVDYTLDANELQAMFEAQRENELSQLYVNNLVYTPTVQFPYNADVLRDVKNNGVLIYKYKLSDSDISRLDRILTMYGYKETETLTTGNFNRRSKFDYVSCTTISVGGLAKWYNDGIAAQLKAGVRIWHILPTPTAYEDNE